MSAVHKLICIAPEPVNAYGVDPIDPKVTTDVDLEFLRMMTFDVTRNAPAAEVATTTPSFSPHPRVNIPKNLSLAFESSIFEARASGTAGGEAPPGFLDFLVAAGFSAAIAAPGDPVVLTPQTEPTPSLTGYCWERVLFGSEMLWTLWRLHGMRCSNFRFGGQVGAVATYGGQAESANFPRDASETAEPFGRTKPLAFFDADGLALDQFGDVVVWTGSHEHALYTPMTTTFARIEIAGSFAAVQDWEITVENTLEERPIEVGGVMMWEQLIASRVTGFTATLKDRDAYLALTESVRDNLTGTPGDELVALEVVMDDGKGVGGTTYTIESTMQYDDPSDGESNGVRNWGVSGRATPDWSSSLYGDDEITITISETT